MGRGFQSADTCQLPAYSEGARKLNLNGPVTAEAVITADGSLEDVRIVRGLPGDLNEQTIACLTDLAVPTCAQKRETCCYSRSVRRELSHVLDSFESRILSHRSW